MKDMGRTYIAFNHFLEPVDSNNQKVFFLR